MSIFTITHAATTPAVLHQAGSVAQAVRAAMAFGAVGLLAALAVVCQPLLGGAFKAVRIFLWLREPAAQRRALRRLEGVEMLTRTANDVAATQPNLAAELRGLAGRD